MVAILIAVVFILILTNVAKREEVTSCKVHSWKEFDQPGMDGVTYLKCTKCNKTPQEVVDEH